MSQETDPLNYGNSNSSSSYDDLASPGKFFQRHKKLKWILICLSILLLLFCILLIVGWIYINHKIKDDLDASTIIITGMSLQAEPGGHHLFVFVNGSIFLPKKDFMNGVSSTALAQDLLVHGTDDKGNFSLGVFPLALGVITVSHGGQSNFSIPMHLYYENEDDLSRFVTLLILANDTDKFHAWVTGNVHLEVSGIPLFGKVTTDAPLYKVTNTPGIHDQIIGPVRIEDLNITTDLKHEEVWVEFTAKMSIINPEAAPYSIYSAHYDIYFDNPQGVHLLFLNYPPKYNIHLTTVHFDFHPNGKPIEPHSSINITYKVGPINAFPTSPWYEPYIRLFYLYEVKNDLYIKAHNGSMDVGLGSTKIDVHFNYENISVPNPNPIPLDSNKYLLPQSEDKKILSKTMYNPPTDSNPILNQCRLGDTLCKSRVITSELIHKTQESPFHFTFSR